jgi:signal transduction histidine kinase
MGKAAADLSDESRPSEVARSAAVVDLTAQPSADEALRIAEEGLAHLSELTEINAKLEQAVAIKDHVLSMATHDMRNPIAAILGFTAVLRSQRGDPETVEIALAAIERQARRLDHLVDDLLSLTLIEGGNIVLSTSSVSLAPLAREVTADTPGAQSCVVDIADDVLVFADPDRVGQIIGNLLSNAVKYGREPIEVSAAGDEWVELRVRDHGPGVSPRHVERLFERFSPVSRSSARSRQGTGLGLAIVRALAEVQGGSVAYEPNLPTGACFVVCLPGRVGGSPAG